MKFKFDPRAGRMVGSKTQILQRHEIERLGGVIPDNRHISPGTAYIPEKDVMCVKAAARRDGVEVTRLNDYDKDIGGALYRFEKTTTFESEKDMKKLNENTKVTLTFSQLRKLVRESLSDDDFVSEDTPVKPFRASDLRKYGFEHEPGADFTDDGNRFYVYRLKGTDMGVSYLRDGNEIYIGDESFGRVEQAKNEVGYDQYSKLPGYRDLGMLNGVSDTSITPDKMQQLVKALTDFEEAILGAASNVQGADPTAVEDLNQKMQELVNQAYSAHRDELKDSLDSIVSQTYKKNFEFYLVQALKELSSIKSLNRPITPGTKSEWDRNRVQNPEKTLADIERSISLYSEQFHNYLDKLKQL